ncbi:ISL3 family transposase, partial [Verminephrobacter aporrectodeae subsp. tuberculatae]
RLLFATEGRDHKTVLDFVDDLKAHGGDSEQVKHVCMDMSAAYAKGVGLGLALPLPQAQISYDRFHVVAMAMDAMDQVRRTEMAQDAPAVREALESAVDNDEHKTLKQL